MIILNMFRTVFVSVVFAASTAGCKSMPSAVDTGWFAVPQGSTVMADPNNSDWIIVYPEGKNQGYQINIKNKFAAGNYNTADGNKAGYKPSN